MYKEDKIKNIKKISRIENNKYGKSGEHIDKREKRIKHMKTKDWLNEAEDIMNFNIDDYDNSEENIECSVCKKEVKFSEAFYNGTWICSKCKN